LAQRVARLLERGNTPPGNIEAAAFGGEPVRHRETDPLAGPGDERALPLQSQVHRYPPCDALMPALRSHQIRRVPDDQ
jgi:hypothetical protein